MYKKEMIFIFSL